MTAALLTIPGLVLLIALVAGCGDATGPEADLPAGAVGFAPPAIYAEWFSRTEACSNLGGSMQSIDFFVVPGTTGFTTGGDDLTRAGRWVRVNGRDRIILAGAFQNHEMVVRHEMLHAIRGKAGHPTELFEQQCRLTWETWEVG